MLDACVSILKFILKKLSSDKSTTEGLKVLELSGLTKKKVPYGQKNILQKGELFETPFSLFSSPKCTRNTRRTNFLRKIRPKKKYNFLNRKTSLIQQIKQVVLSNENYSQ